MKKKAIFLLFLSTVLACKNDKPKNSSLFSEDPSIFDLRFSNYKEIPQLEEYSKISDTTFFDKQINKEFRITEIKNDTSHLILFNELFYDNKDNEVYTILDTLALDNMQEGEFISIGYCDYQKLEMPQIVAKFRMMENDSLSEIKKAWLADPVKKAFKRIYELDSIGCEFQIIKEQYLKLP
ncbi:hypothetical protein [Gramella sp. AN32]|uniref:Lipoprotein n=1 Tax=Christiangramia antarctica TaxID=2058158 RepID=A0ABW5X5P3_9FLAO|nr:hypothetical protein [Gramella sp. AN32]